MDPHSTVIFNGACPICSVEVSAYRRHAEALALPLRFVDLTRGDLAALGLTPDQAARRLYMLHDGQMYSGIDAFVHLWAAMPRYRWLARIVGLPVIRPLARLIYDHVAAPLLYALHRRRERRR